MVAVIVIVVYPVIDFCRNCVCRMVKGDFIPYFIFHILKTALIKLTRELESAQKKAAQKIRDGTAKRTEVEHDRRRRE